MNGVSVIICCYNSAGRIAETLKYLSLQKVTNFLPWEVIVVNNASSDSTAEIANIAWTENRGHTKFQIVDQPVPGLAHARTKGIEVSRYNFLIFCDDDNHFESNYVQEAFNIMIQHPEIGIAGGLIKPKLSFYPGKWIESNYAALAIGQRSIQPGYVDWVFGAGMVFRKKIFSELKQKGIKFMLSGRLGTKQTSGDDAEMCRLAQFIGYKIYYSDNLILHHKISSHRLTRWSFVKANFMNVYPVVYFYLLDNLIKKTNASAKNVYFHFFNSRFYNTIYFLPRVFFGKNNFFSFMMFFQNFQLLLWLVLNVKRFTRIHNTIKANLYHGIE